MQPILQPGKVEPGKVEQTFKTFENFLPSFIVSYG
jgi:hypothetical protein